MRIDSLAITLVLVWACSATTQAQPISPPSEAAPQSAPAPKPLARYSFDRVNGVLLRLDTATGQVSVCSQHGAGWVCETVPEDRAALESEIGRLQKDIAALKAEIAALREPPPRPPADLAPRDSDATIKMPTHEDIARARAKLNEAWQRLVDMIVGFKNDIMKKS